MPHRFSDNDVEEAIRLIPTGQSTEKWRDFHVDEQGHLVHTLSKRRVVPQSQIVPLLTEFYAQPSWKSGRDRFYKRIAEQFMGITRNDVMDFLRKQEVWQLYQPLHKFPVRQTVLANRPLDRWQIDLIDFSAQAALNNNDKYVLTAMDCFTKYAFAKPIKSKTAAAVATALRQIFEDPVLRGRLPKIIQSDRGGEFKEEVSKLFAERGIKQVFSQPYKPTTQGLIERFNGTLKRAIFQHMTQFGTNKWNDLLPELTAGYNQSRHSVTRVAPKQLMDPTVGDEILATARERIHKAAKRRLLRSQNRLASLPEIRVGDSVRISARSDAEVRRMELLGQSLGKRANWSKEIYRVTHVSRPADTALTLPQYRVESSEGDAVAQRFYRNDLQKIDAGALMINQAERPDYSHGAIFNQEKHLQAVQRSRAAAIEEPQEATRPTRPQRPERPKRSATPPRPERPAGPERPAPPDPIYEVAEIMQQRQRNRQPIFLVRWENYPSEPDWTWEPLAHIKHTEAFAAWKKRRH